MTVPASVPVPRAPDGLDAYAALERRVARDWVEGVGEARRAAMGLRCVTVDDGNDVIACEQHPHLLCNRVVGRGLGADRRAFARALAALRCARPDNFLVALQPGAAAPPGAGLQRFRRDSIVLTRDVSPRVTEPGACPIERADRRHLGAIAAIFAECFGLPEPLAQGFAGVIGRPHWHGYVALAGGTPVAAALMLVLDDTAYLAGAATRPGARGRGVHDALIARRIAVARALGVRRLFVDTGSPVAGEPSPSLDNLRGAGFVALGVRAQWAAPATTWTGAR